MPTNPCRYSFMGCPIDSHSFDQATYEIVTKIKQRSKTSLVHFLNVAKVVKARRDQCLMKALWDGDLVLTDGKPLLFFGKFLGIQLATRVNGTDLMEQLLEVSEKEGFGVYLLGARNEILQKCVANIKIRYPNINIVGYRNGYFRNSDASTIIKEVNRVQPDILFIGMGTPQKEIFSFYNRDKFSVPIIQGVGGSFDVLAGEAKRAPKWMQCYGLEWFFRILQEPKRMFWRYLSTNTIFLVSFFPHAIRFFLKSKTQFFN